MERLETLRGGGVGTLLLGLLPLRGHEVQAEATGLEPR